MAYAIEYLSTALKKAREEKKLSQRALSKRVGMPQAQISRIENAVVDPQISSLIELARALDLEVMLVPRNQVPVVKGIVASRNVAEDDSSPQPAYLLSGGDDDG